VPRKAGRKKKNKKEIKGSPLGKKFWRFYFEEDEKAVPLKNASRPSWQD